MEKVFPEKVAGDWADKLRTIVPSYGTKLNDDPDALEREWQETAEVLQLALPMPTVDRSLIGETGVDGAVQKVPDMAL